MKKSPQLTPRLETVASLVPSVSLFADIGTDHAYLPVKLCLDGVCETAVASDISEGPLQRAGATVSEYGLNNRISLRLGGGLDTLDEGEADAVSIAGMGGLMIADILISGRSKLKNAKQIVIQPMSSVPEMRKLLLENGFEITAERLSKEDEKLYHIMTVMPSEKTAEPTISDVYIGKRLIEAMPEHFEEYTEREKRRYLAVADGLKNAKNADTEKLSTALAILKELGSL